MDQFHEVVAISSGVVLGFLLVMVLESWFDALELPHLRELRSCLWDTIGSGCFSI